MFPRWHRGILGRRAGSLWAQRAEPIASVGVTQGSRPSPEPRRTPTLEACTELDLTGLWVCTSTDLRPR